MIIKVGNKGEFNIALVDKNLASDIKYRLKGDFEGKKGQNLIVGEDRAYVGLDEIGDEYLGYREVGFNTGKLIKKIGVDKVDLDLSLLYEADLPNYLLGLYMTVHTKKTYKSDKKEDENKEVEVFIKNSFADGEVELEYLEDYIAEAKILAENLMQARNFVNTPSNLLYPLEFARQIEEFVSDKNLKIDYKIVKHDELVSRGMGLINVVGESADNEPCLVTISYMGNPGSEEILGLVGKGVCMDTGGYCLKPGSSIYDMKGDMAGAAAVVCALKSIAQRKLNINVKAIVPLVENRISRASFVPSDVITSYSGKTVEIINTDAEGRLILADAITYAIRDEKVTKLIDIATLTGAVVGMLGQTITGVMTNDEEEFYNIFDASSYFYGERHLLLPYYDEHEEMIKSEFADIKNLGDKFCGTITAGLFMKAFTEDTPWIHFDIAGTSKMDKPVFSYEEAGPTGAGVVSLYSLAKAISEIDEEE